MPTPKPYYSEDGITIYCGDCREILPEVNAELSIADPPYNVGLKYASHDDAMPEAEYEAWCRDWFGLLRVATRRSIIFAGVSPKQRNMRLWLSLGPGCVGCWYKPGNPAGGGLVQFCEWEPWLYWGKFIGGSDVIRATVRNQEGIGSHPCPKPLSLIGQMLDRTKPRSVIDPFVGSGTTLVAAKLRGIPAVGIEIEERYCEIAVKRLAQGVLPLEPSHAH